MSDSTPASTSLQFDHAEYAGAAEPVRCAACQQLIEREYFQINGSIVCSLCRPQFDALRDRGTRTSRFLRATGAGTAAGIAGALLYFGVAKLTGYEFSLIAIVVGFGVGGAVRWGCYRRGGPLYQALAIALTYLSIVSTYVPSIVEGLMSNASNESAADAGATQAQPSPEGTTATVSATSSGAPTDGASPPRGVVFALAMVFVLAIAVAAPFLGGLENIMGIIIIGIGVYEAWKINKRMELTITGPHALATPAAVAAPEAT